MGPPLCAVVLLNIPSGLTWSFFLDPVAIVLALRVQDLGSVKRLETIVLLWRYINKIELKYLVAC